MSKNHEWAKTIQISIAFGIYFPELRLGCAKRKAKLGIAWL